MSNDLLPPSDELLSAWLDSELDDAAQARVQAWLQAHPDDAARLRLWAADRDALRARLAPGLDEPLPGAWVDVATGTPPARRTGGSWEALAAQWVLAVGLGAAMGAWWARPGGEPAALVGAAPLAAGSAPTIAEDHEPWLQFAALAHAVYVPEKRHPVEVAVEGDPPAKKAQEEHLSRWLTKRLDVPVKMFDLREQGYRLVGGRLLPETNGPCAQLMYEDAAGQRVTVYLRRKGADAPASFRYEELNGLGLFYWVEGPAGYALVGPAQRERLLALAEAIYRSGRDSIGSVNE
jgi:anti-sigma factor RsiW